MNIEIRGINFFNKGSELMLEAVLNKLREEIPGALFVMEVSAFSARSKYRQKGIYSKVTSKKGFSLQNIFTLIPPFILKRWHYIPERKIDIVLDCSGFAFGDVWGAGKAWNRIGKHILKWKKQGKKVIMLPQAFGPFVNKGLIKEMKHILLYTDLVFARDEISYKHLKQLYDSDKIICAPDFTNLVEGRPPSYFDIENYQVAIIVNSKMTEEQMTKDAGVYINFLHRIITLIKKLNFKPYFLIHATDTDIAVAEMVNQKLRIKLPVIAEENPILLKGIIAQSTAVITSRFHGLVSCLSQAVPCLATNWSHKYEMLLKDYNYSEGLLDVNCSDELLIEKVKSILAEPSRGMIIKKLHDHSMKQKQLSMQMWKQVLNVIKDADVKLTAVN
jgi:colanic acid/amylovoran biosynthesis protein